MDSASVDEELGFAVIARRVFDPVAAAYGLRLNHHTRNRVSYGTREVSLELVYDELRSREVAVLLGQPLTPEPPLALSDVLSYAAAPPECVRSAELLQTSNMRLVESRLAEWRAYLEQYAGSLLSGDDSAFAEAYRRRSDRASRYMFELLDRKKIAEADQAWRRRDYGKVVQILSPLSDHLSPAQSKKLEMARRRMR